MFMGGEWSGEKPLADFMRPLLTGYAIFYSKVHKRVGHVFQNRYKSIVCDKDEYLLPLIRYVHLNPVKAKVVDWFDLKKYRWTGHKELVEKQKEGLISHKYSKTEGAGDCWGSRHG